MFQLCLKLATRVPINNMYEYTKERERERERANQMAEGHLAQEKGGTMKQQCANASAAL